MNSSSWFRWLSCGLLLPLSFVACLFAAAVGGGSFGIAPDFNLKLVEGLACPDGSQLTYRLGAEESFQTFPNETSPAGSETSGRSFFVRCVDETGELVAKGDGLLIRTLALILGSYFLACLLPLWAGTTVILFFIRRRTSAAPDPTQP